MALRSFRISRRTLGYIYSTVVTLSLLERRAIKKSAQAKTARMSGARPEYRVMTVKRDDESEKRKISQQRLRVSVSRFIDISPEDEETGGTEVDKASFCSRL